MNGSCSGSDGDKGPVGSRNTSASGRTKRPTKTQKRGRRTHHFTAFAKWRTARRRRIAYSSDRSMLDPLRNSKEHLFKTRAPLGRRLCPELLERALGDDSR